MININHKLSKTGFMVMYYFGPLVCLKNLGALAPGPLGNSNPASIGTWWLVCGDLFIRARHWCLPHCPGQVEFVNYSCGASENCILLAPLGKYVLYISGLLLRMCASFRGLPSKLVLENMLSHARTMFYLVLNEIL